MKALTLFQIFYDDDGITREDIFHYVYALLHHPAYRTRYAENLKRELPRIPFVGVAAARKKARPPAFSRSSAVETMQGDAKPDHNPKASAKLFHAFAAAGQETRRPARQLRIRQGVPVEAAGRTRRPSSTGAWRR